MRIRAAARECNVSRAGSYWWCDPATGLKYQDVGSPADARAYYDDMAEDYEAAVRGWGYNCPEVRGVTSHPRLLSSTAGGG